MLHTNVPNNPYPHTIVQGTDWDEMFLSGYSLNNVPDIYNWSATYVVFPNLDPSQEPVIALGTSAGMTITYANDTESTVTTSGITLGVQGTLVNTTTANGAKAQGTSVVTVANTTNLAVGRLMAIVLSDTTIHLDSVSALAGSNATISTPLSDAVLNGADVKVFDERWSLTNVALHLGKSITEGLTSWGVGLYRFDLMDTFGHTQLSFSGTCCLQRGYGHG